MSAAHLPAEGFSSPRSLSPLSLAPSPLSLSLSPIASGDYGEFVSLMRSYAEQGAREAKSGSVLSFEPLVRSVQE